MELAGVMKRASLLSVVVLAGSMGFPASAQQATQPTEAEGVSRVAPSGTATNGVIHTDIDLKSGGDDAGSQPVGNPHNVPVYRYEKNSSDVVHYDLPDASVKPLELRMQDMERRISEMESRMSEVEDHLRDVIVAVNHIIREGAR
jgi:hypothetical protein